MKYQWSSTAGALMLNTDVELVYDIDVDNYGNGTTCKMNAGSDHACAESSTKALVESYASVSLVHISIKYSIPIFMRVHTVVNTVAYIKLYIC